MTTDSEMDDVLRNYFKKRIDLMPPDQLQKLFKWIAYSDKQREAFQDRVIATAPKEIYREGDYYIAKSARK